MFFDRVDKTRISTPWLWQELAELRQSKVHSSSKSGWKIFAGCTEVWGVYPDIKVTSDDRHTLSQWEAAIIVMAAIWNNTLRAQIAPVVRSGQLRPDDAQPFFDRWMDLASQRGWTPELGGGNVKALLTTISIATPPTMSARQVLADPRTSAHVAAISQGKGIPSSTIRSWLGGSTVDRPLSSQEVINLLQQIKRWKPKAKPFQGLRRSA